MASLFTNLVRKVVISRKWTENGLMLDREWTDEVAEKSARMSTVWAMMRVKLVNLVNFVMQFLKWTKWTKWTEQICAESAESAKSARSIFATFATFASANFVGKASCESTVRYREWSRISLIKPLLNPYLTLTRFRLSLGSNLSRFSLASLICLCMLTVGVGNAWGTRTYTAISNLSELTTGDSVIIAIHDGATASKWWGMQVNTSNNLQGTYSVLTVSSNSVTNPNKSITWYVTKNAGTPTTYTFTNKVSSTTYYICGKTDKTDCQTTISAPSGTQKTTWYITQHSGIYFKLQLENSSGRVMCANGTTPNKMAVYATSSTFVHQVTAKKAVCQFADELTIFKKETCTALGYIKGSVLWSNGTLLGGGRFSRSVGRTLRVD